MNNQLKKMKKNFILHCSLPPLILRFVTGRSCANLSKICLIASSVSACSSFSISTSGILNYNK